MLKITKFSYIGDPATSFVKDDINLDTTLLPKPPSRNRNENNRLTFKQKAYRVPLTPGSKIYITYLWNIKSMKDQADARKLVEDEEAKIACDWNMNPLLYRICHDLTQEDTIDVSLRAMSHFKRYAYDPDDPLPLRPLKWTANNNGNWDSHYLAHMIRVA
ncbi:hypothetical protein C1646_754388 [Rhizophagus diaphanus]|nr:hypothetical protein C1646_754388 [Rhizophagus diaphanus] [Rhizophagus sp. MUCL 43196]